MPATVKVGPFDLAVAADADGHLAAETEAGTRLDGRSSGRDQVIHIHPQHTATYQKSTMIHEIIHMVFLVAGTVITDDDAEQICRALEGGLLGVLRENPDLVAWLTAE